MTILFYVLPTVYQNFCCSTFSIAFGIIIILKVAILIDNVVVSHCLNFHFPDEIFCDISLSMLICYLNIFFGEMSVKVLGPFLNCVIFVLNFKSSLFLFFFPSSPLLGVYLANIFSVSSYFLILLIVSCRAEVFNVNNVQLINILTISFIDCAFGVISKTLLPYPRSLRFSTNVIYEEFYSFAFYI